MPTIRRAARQAASATIAILTGLGLTIVTVVVTLAAIVDQIALLAAIALLVAIAAVVAILNVLAWLQR